MRVNGGRAVAEVLKEQKAAFVFGIPGGQTLWVTDALIGSDVTFIPTRHEGAAGHAADAYGRLTGKPGYCLATTGPGATNLITPMGGAMRDSSPMVVIVFQNRNSDYFRGDAQEADHRSLFSGLCKAYLPVQSADAAVWAMREAYRIAMTGRKGPVVVDLFRDAIEEQETDYTFVDPTQYCFDEQHFPNEEKVKQAAEKLLNAEKLVIYCGNGVKSARVSDQVIELAELLRAPIVTSFNGIGSVSTEHELVFGPRSRHGSKLTRGILEDADLVLVLGSSMSAVATNRWSIQLKEIIQIDKEEKMIGRSYPASIGIAASLEPALESLIQEVKDGKEGKLAERKQWLEELWQREKQWKQDVFSGEIADSKATPAPPIAVMAELGKALKEGSILCSDAGNPGAWAHLLPIKKGMRFMKPVNYGNMGFAIPAAIACQLAEPETEVVAILGDGSLGMTLAELETASRLKVPVKIVLFNDGAFGNIKQEELYKFGENRYIGVDLSDLDYFETAKTLGCNAICVEKAEDLSGALEAARQYDGPTMIEVKFDGSYTVWPEAF